MLAPLAHLADAASAPPNMGLCVDEDRRSHRVAIGNPLRCEAIDETCGRRHKSLCFTLPEGDEPGTAYELEHPASGWSVRPQTIGRAHAAPNDAATNNASW